MKFEVKANALQSPAGSYHTLPCLHISPGKPENIVDLVICKVPQAPWKFTRGCPAAGYGLEGRVDVRVGLDGKADRRALYW